MGLKKMGWGFVVVLAMALVALAIWYARQAIPAPGTTSTPIDQTEPPMDAATDAPDIVAAMVGSSMDSMGPGVGEACGRIYPEVEPDGLVMECIGVGFMRIDPVSGKMSITKKRAIATRFVFHRESAGTYALRSAGWYVGSDMSLGGFDGRVPFSVKSRGGNLVAIAPISLPVAVAQTGFANVGTTVVRLSTDANDPSFFVCSSREQVRADAMGRNTAHLKVARDTDPSCRSVIGECTAEERVRYPQCCDLAV